MLDSIKDLSNNLTRYENVASLVTSGDEGDGILSFEEASTLYSMAHGDVEGTPLENMSEEYIQQLKDMSDFLIDEQPDGTLTLSDEGQRLADADYVTADTTDITTGISRNTSVFNVIDGADTRVVQADDENPSIMGQLFGFEVETTHRLTSLISPDISSLVDNQLELPGDSGGQVLADETPRPTPEVSPTDHAKRSPFNNVFENVFPGLGMSESGTFGGANGDDFSVTSSARRTYNDRNSFVGLYESFRVEDNTIPQSTPGEFGFNDRSARLYQNTEGDIVISINNFFGKSPLSNEERAQNIETLIEDQTGQEGSLTQIDDTTFVWSASDSAIA